MQLDFTYIFYTTTPLKHLISRDNHFVKTSPYMRA